MKTLIQEHLEEQIEAEREAGRARLRIDMDDALSLAALIFVIICAVIGAAVILLKL